jgi:Flp pilus assembly protein TadB
MDAGIPVMVLVSLTAGFTLYAFVLEIRRSSESSRLITWLETERTEAWDALSRSDRFLAVRALEILRRGALFADEEYLTRFRRTKHGKRFAVAMIASAAAIALLLIGTSFLDWRW